MYVARDRGKKDGRTLRDRKEGIRRDGMGGYTVEPTMEEMGRYEIDKMYGKLVGRN